MKKRATIIVLDSAGIGSLPDAVDFGDAGAHTFGHVYAHRGMKIPNMLAMGLGNIKDSRLPRVMMPSAAYGRSLEVTKAKDTTSGHWEMAGFPMEVPFRTYPNGFPEKLMAEFEAKIGRGTLGNEVASGTEIIQRLGDEHHVESRNREDVNRPRRDEGAPVVLLSHQPRFAHEYAKYPISLQLSGHTHGGMIAGLPALLVKIANKGFVSGLYRVGDMTLYVSNGAGLWNGFMFRLGVPSVRTRLTWPSLEKTL